MAYEKRFFDPTASGSKGTKTMAIYQSTTDNAAAIKASNYFNSAWNELSRVAVLLVVASDATFLAKVTVTNKVVTLAALDAF